MSWFRRSEFTDSEIEALLTGANDNASLAPVATAFDRLRSLRDLEQPEPPAALIAQVTVLARETSRDAGVRPIPSRRSWRLAPAAAAVALALATFMPLAAVANSAVPGESLFALDLILERVRIGAGGVAERLAEVDVLNDRGEVAEAAQHLALSVSSASPEDLASHRALILDRTHDLGVSERGVDVSEVLVDVLTAIGAEVPVTPPADDTNSGPGNSNQGPGNNSGNGNTEPGNPNQGPGNNSGNGNTEPGNPNQGPGNNSGNGNTDPGNQGNGNPNKGPGNNSGNGNTDPGNQGENTNKGPGKNSGNP